MGSWPNASKIGGNLVGRRAMAMTVLEQSRREVVNAMAASGPAPLLARLVMVGPPELMPKVRERLYEFIKTPEGIQLRRRAGRHHKGTLVDDDDVRAGLAEEIAQRPHGAVLTSRTARADRVAPRSASWSGGVLPPVERARRP